MRAESGDGPVRVYDGEELDRAASLRSAHGASERMGMVLLSGDLFVVIERESNRRGVSPQIVLEEAIRQYVSK